MELDELSKKMGFDVAGMVKPKTVKDITTLLDELLMETKNLSDNLDEAMDRVASETFIVGDHTFYQYLDRKDTAHIEQLTSAKKEEILSLNRPAQVGDIEEIFTIDASYCNFKNKHGTIVGRVKCINWDTEQWAFVSEEINETVHHIPLKCKYPYDGEREVIKWMVEHGLLDTFVNHK